MNCDERLLESYQNGELSQQQAQAVKEHLVTCESCSATLSELQSLNDMLGAYPHVEIDYATLYQLQQIPHQTKKRFSLFSFFPRELALVAASVLCAFFIGSFINTQATPEHSDLVAEHDYFEQVSLVSLIDENI